MAAAATEASVKPSYLNTHGEIFSLRNAPIVLTSPVPWGFVAAAYIAIFIRPTAWVWGRMFLTWFVVASFALTMNHRFFSHGAFKTSRPFRFLCACAACLGMQKGPLWWSCKHRKHHKKCDLPGDPHSWVQTNFMYAWLGWVHAVEEQAVEEEFLHPSMFITDDKGKKRVAPELVWIDHWYWAPFCVMHLFFLFVVGWTPTECLLNYTAPSLACPSPILLFNVMFHPPQHTPTKVGCYALDSLLDPLAFLFGEAAHEDHHVMPARARRPGFLDVSWSVIIKPLWCLGLIWEPKVYDLA